MKNDFSRRRNDRPVEDLIQQAFAHVTKWHSKGLCLQCAITAASVDCDCDRNKLATLYMDEQYGL